MKTRISVIIPVYNVQEFLEECVDSVLNQTILDFELGDYDRNLQIILVDDGSTDNSSIIAKEYANNYENVEYIYEENQGLGHARNYGCEFVEGDYLTFLDSDDLIPPKAYERMYKLATKNDSDLTIGNVWRFNSKATWDSAIHKRAFIGTKEVTTILESNELIYDTISCNKLIKHDFWKRNGFKFPEGVLYEDIPVTIPMYYLANNVSIVYQCCYLWRVREGISKSITQTATELKNIKDRLFVISKVDDFFGKNVTDNNLILAKNVKWLKVDLMIFINKLISSSKNQSEVIMDILIDYINDNIDLQYLDYLTELEQLKYEFLLNKDYDKLINLLNFEYEDLESSNLSLDDSKLVVECGEEICKTGYLPIEKHLKDCNLMSRILNISFKKNYLEIKGFSVIPGFKVDSFDDQEISFNLINEYNSERIPLKYEKIKIKDFVSTIPFSNSVSYESAGYKIFISYSEIRDNNNVVGENRILMTLKQKSIEYNFFLGTARKKLIDNINFNAIMRGDNYFFTRFDFNKEFVLDISPVKYRYEKLSIEGNKLCIHSPKFYGDIFVTYEKTHYHDEYRIPFEYDEKSQVYCVEIEKLPNLSGKVVYDDGKPLVHKWKKLMLLNSKYGQFTVNSLKDYHYDITKYNSITEIEEITNNGSSIYIKSKLYSNNLEGKKFESANLLFKDNKSNSIYSIAEGILSDNNEIEYKFDIKKNDFTKNLYQGFFDLIVQYNFNDLTFSTPLYLLKQFRYTFSDNSYDYSVYRSNKWTLRIKSKRKWPYFENNKQKREKISNKYYGFFRHFPINNKRILFESMWGAKYSCNPRYFYEFIDNNCPDYECIWSLNDEHIPINGKGVRVRKNSLKYFYYLATSKFFVNNVNFANHYVKREGQIEIQTMHGTPLKTLGLDVDSEFKTEKQRKEYIQKCGRWDYLTVQSDYVAEISKSCYEFGKKFLNYGYPRTDLLFTKNNIDEINELKSKIGLPLDKKIILYAPTWREKNNFDLMLDLNSLKKSLSDEYILILRLHHLSFKDWTAPKEDDFVYDLSRYDSIEELYLVSDILVTDYSSVMFDYANLDRPIILFTYDLKEYRDKLRGFYIDIVENRPGPLVYSSKELEDAILNIGEVEKENKEIRQRFREKFNQYESGNSSEMIFNEVMRGNKNSNLISRIVDKIITKFIK